jgi:hypothetical protein
MVPERKFGPPGKAHFVELINSGRNRPCFVGGDAGEFKDAVQYLAVVDLRCQFRGSLRRELTLIVKSPMSRAVKASHTTLRTSASGTIES